MAKTDGTGDKCFKLYTRMLLHEAYVIATEAGDMWSSIFEANKELNRFKNLHKSNWYLWLFGAIFFIALYFDQKAIAWIALVLGVGTGLNVAVSTYKLEKKVEKLHDNLDVLALSWHKKFGERADIYKLRETIEQIEGTEIWTFLEDEEAFQRWWLGKKGYIYRLLYGSEQASELLEEEWKYFHKNYTADQNSPAD